ncbi:MAG: MBL fold metallo-hydrolase [Myxococcota bacterium]
MRTLRTASLLLMLGAGCAASTHATAPAALGVVRPASAMLAVMDLPGPIEVESVSSADWKVPLSGLVNLEDPAAKAAGLEERDEPIQIFFHALRHPSLGTYLVDTGVEQKLRDDPEHALVRGFLASAMGGDLRVKVALGDWIAQHPGQTKGVLLTHLHLDHVMGLRDVPREVPVYAGPGETEATNFMNVFVQSVIDESLEGRSALSTWQFGPDPDGRFDGVLDVFGDGSLWAIWVPGHTPGSTAYLARTPNGPVLFTGDACHTTWGWDHHVEPGSFSGDLKASKRSLEKLLSLGAEHPRLEVRLGHQG